MTTPTPLLRMLRALSPEQRSALADACGTTVVYLYQLATQPHPNPRLRLAQALVHEAKGLRRRRVGIDPLTFDALLIGTSDEPAPAPRPD